MSEVWVDTSSVEIPSPETWPTLSLDQLLDTKTKLINRVYMARGRKEYTTPLVRAIARIDGFIAQKMAGTGGPSVM